MKIRKETSFANATINARNRNVENKPVPWHSLAFFLLLGEDEEKSQFNSLRVETLIIRLQNL